MASDGKKRKKPKKKGLDDSPQLVTHKDVAAKFGLTTEALRSWVKKRQFPMPYMEIGRIWFYRAEDVDFKLRTKRWPSGVRFWGDRPQLDGPPATDGP